MTFFPESWYPLLWKCAPCSLPASSRSERSNRWEGKILGSYFAGDVDESNNYSFGKSLANNIKPPY